MPQKKPRRAGPTTLPLLHARDSTRTCDREGEFWRSRDHCLACAACHGERRRGVLAGERIASQTRSGTPFRHTRYPFGLESNEAEQEAQRASG
jgi:hypothetical protein